MVKTNPIWYLLSKPILSGRLAKWSLQFSEFGITCLMPTRIKDQAVIDLIKSFSSENESSTIEEVPREQSEAMHMSAD